MRIYETRIQERKTEYFIKIVGLTKYLGRWLKKRSFEQTMANKPKNSNLTLFFNNTQNPVNPTNNG